MKKLIYIIILAAFYSCSLFSQPDTTCTVSYSVEWGDSVLAENTKLKDSLIQLNYIHNLVIDRLDSLTLLTDTAYWSNFNHLTQVDMRQEGDRVEMIITKADSTWIRFIYVNNYSGYIVKRRYEDAKHIGNGSSNW